MSAQPHAAMWPGDRGGHIWPKDQEAVSSDGVRVRFTVLGDDGPWVVLCPGWMCPDNFWAGIAPRLAERNRVLVLNYRSMGASTDPRPVGFLGTGLRSDDYTIAKAADDVVAAMDAVGATGATLIGHSMGCQVALATWRLAGSERVAALSLVTGTHRSPFTSFYGMNMSAAFPLVFAGAHLTARPIQKAIPKLLKLPMTMDVARLIRALGPKTPDDGMDLYFDHFQEVDPLIALRFGKGMHEFDADAWLDEVDIPVLVLVASNDTFTPPSLGQNMLDKLQHGELRVIVDGTHAAIIEVPQEVHDAIEDFKHRRLGHAEVSTMGDPSVITATRVA